MKYGYSNERDEGDEGDEGDEIREPVYASVSEIRSLFTVHYWSLLHEYTKLKNDAFF